MRRIPGVDGRTRHGGTSLSLSLTEHEILVASHSVDHIGLIVGSFRHLGVQVIQDDHGKAHVRAVMDGGTCREGIDTLSVWWWWAGAATVVE